MPNEIQEDGLMDQNELQMEQNDYLQLGFVHLAEPSFDPVLSARFTSWPSLHSKANPEATRIWAHHLAPGLSKSTVMIPQSWADFFTTLLINPSTFAWAKQMLTS